MNPLKTYDYLEQARTKIFNWVRPLTPDQYCREFPIGLGSVARTLTHIMICEWLYMQRIQQKPVPPYNEWPIQDEQPPAFPDLERAWLDQASQTRAALAAVQDWTSDIEYQTKNDGEAILITASRMDIFTQLALHEVHHRAQALNMLRQLGVKLEDIDYNAIMYKRRSA